jgi:MFS transporter, FLVCR family, MFS-domain-containing protein 7
MGAIIATVVFPFGFILQEQPPTPPTFAGSTKSPGMTSLFKALVGKEPVDSTQYMDLRDRVDFGLLFLVFGVYVSLGET